MSQHIILQLMSHIGCSPREQPTLQCPHPHDESLLSHSSNCCRKIGAIMSPVGAILSHGKKFAWLVTLAKATSTGWDAGAGRREVGPTGSTAERFKPINHNIVTFELLREVLLLLEVSLLLSSSAPLASCCCCARAAACRAAACRCRYSIGPMIGPARNSSSAIAMLAMEWCNMRESGR